MTSLVRPVRAVPLVRRVRLVRSFTVLLTVLAAACGGGSSGPAHPSPQKSANENAPPLSTGTLAGQRVPVLPVTIVVAEDTLAQMEPFSVHAHALAWADSIVGEVLQERSPEVKWVLPAELRKVALRAPGIAPDPDHMGQGILRASKMDVVPDPLRSNLRALVALTNARFAFVPAAIGILPDSMGGVRADISMVLADIRTGQVVWRAVATGSDAKPSRALIAAIARVLPSDVGP